MFKVQFEDQKKEKQFVWQTSWGFTTRSIGAMIMVHADNKGLVLPPRIARYQIILIPIIFKDDDSNALLDKIHELKKGLLAKGIRCHVDDRDNYNPGWKFNHWEIKGVPLRCEFGKKDFEKGEVKVVHRMDNQKY